MDLLKEIISVMNSHFRQVYAHYDTHIDETNLLEHIDEICRRHQVLETRLYDIRKICEE